MINFVKTDSQHPDFIALVRLLDAELAIRDGDDHAFYSQFNKIDAINHVVLAYSENKAVGCGAFKPFSEKEVELKRMFVAPENRNQNIGSLLIGQLEKWALELGYQACVLETGINQPEAIRLYQKNGFVRIDNFGQYAGIDSSLCFSKTLRPTT